MLAAEGAASIPGVAWPLISISVVLVTAVGAYVTYLVRRKTTSGTVATSDASVLWQQSQVMMTMLADGKTKAEEQRDRLIDAQANQVVPALDLVNASLTAISTMLMEIVTKLDEGLDDG